MFQIMMFVFTVLAGCLVTAGHVRQTDVPRVAFSAGLTKSLNVSEHVNVTFDRVWVNVGNGYNPTTGVFTAPHDGTYSIMYHGLAEYDGTLWLDLYKNSNYLSSAYAHITGQYGAASNSIVLALTAGDELYITGHGSSILYGLPDDVYATFTGYLLFYAAS
ncbi:complement C1q-like protein 3 isoform X2 [Physella acuta]|uniref:complement C1q-like protein 3 isoform X2 n=1 Tax=Physella acuta TaxID=109671 RepID=UPI0027DDD9E0|nr:complement C1q-like protein 3 isoform X2 [Physella acuta]